MRTPLCNLNSAPSSEHKSLIHSSDGFYIGMIYQSAFVLRIRVFPYFSLLFPSWPEAVYLDIIWEICEHSSRGLVWTRTDWIHLKPREPFFICTWIVLRLSVCNNDIFGTPLTLSLSSYRPHSFSLGSARIRSFVHDVCPWHLASEEASGWYALPNCGWNCCKWHFLKSPQFIELLRSEDAQLSSGSLPCGCLCRDEVQMFVKDRARRRFLKEKIYSWEYFGTYTICHSNFELPFVKE